MEKKRPRWNARFAGVLLLAAIVAVWLRVDGNQGEPVVGKGAIEDGAVAIDPASGANDVSAKPAPEGDSQPTATARHEPSAHDVLADMGAAGVGAMPLGDTAPLAGAELLARHPGPHMGDVIARDVVAAWESEGTSHMSVERERKLIDLFADQQHDTVQHVECKTSLCRVVFHAAGLAAAVPTASRLGFNVAVLENNPERVVILVPANKIDELSRTQVDS